MQTAYTFTGPTEVNAYRAIICKQALKLHMIGIKPGRGWTKTKTLALASSYTGRSYKLSEIDDAVHDMEDVIEAMRAGVYVTPEVL